MQIESNNTTSLAANSATQSTADAEAIQLPQQTLGQQDFLNLLCTQLENQDPMNPMSDTDFVAQMAQFSTLSTMDTMQSNVAQQQANELIGRDVTLKDSSGNLVSGTVDSIVLDSTGPLLVVGGNTYNLSQLVSITTPPATTTSPTSNVTSSTTSAN